MFSSIVTAMVSSVGWVTLLFSGGTEPTPPQTTDTPEAQFWKLYKAANLEDRRNMSTHQDGGGITMKYAVSDPRTGVTFTLTKHYGC